MTTEQFKLANELSDRIMQLELLRKHWSKDRPLQITMDIKSLGVSSGNYDFTGWPILEPNRNTSKMDLSDVDFILTAIDNRIIDLKSEFEKI